MKYTEGVMHDGAVILCDGVKMQISEILYLLNEYNKAEREARQIATILHKNYYANESPDFELLDTVAGIITQIDNMTTGLKKGE